jgi:hypothetical protein
MERSMFADAEIQLVKERTLKFQGTAKINLNQIVPHLLVSREIDQKNVERLCKIFSKSGCERLSIHHYITTIISKQHLETALQARQASAWHC